MARKQHKRVLQEDIPGLTYEICEKMLKDLEKQEDRFCKLQNAVWIIVSMTGS